MERRLEITGGTGIEELIDAVPDSVGQLQPHPAGDLFFIKRGAIFA